MKSMGWSQGLSVTADGTGMVPLAGAAAVRLLADRVGLTAALSVALTRRRFVPVHDRGRVLVDVATVLTAGGEAIGDIDTLRHHDRPVGSGRVAGDGVASSRRSHAGRVEADRGGPGQGPPARLVAPARWTARRLRSPAPISGTSLCSTSMPRLVTAHSEKEQAAANFKGGFGFHPLGVWCDNTGELLAIRLRPGNANANHAQDHIDLLGDAINQIPAAHRRRVLIRADSAGASHQVLDWLTEQDQVRGRSVEYSIGFPINKGIQVHDAIRTLPEPAWTTAIDADGEVRDGAQVAELTGLLDLRKWPAGMRVIVRREKPHPGAGLTLFEQADGWRYQAFATNTRIGQSAFLEARHRAHARVEDRIRTAKDTGLGRFPSREFTINQVWVQIAAIAADLVAWLQLLALNGDLAKAEPKTAAVPDAARPCPPHPRRPPTPAPTPSHWPWADQIAEAFTKILALPAPT